MSYGVSFLEMLLLIVYAIIIFLTCVRVWMIDQGGGRDQDGMGLRGLVLAAHHRANIWNKW